MGWTRVDAVGQLGTERRDRRDCSIGLVRSLNRLAVYTCVIDPPPINFRLDGSLRCTTIRLCTADNRCLRPSCAWHINDLRSTQGRKVVNWGKDNLQIFLFLSDTIGKREREKSIRVK